MKAEGHHALLDSPSTCTQAHAISSTEGALELHTHDLIPSLRQVVFQGDRLPFQCSASYLGNDTHINWYHNRALVEGNEQAGIVLAESLIHDCTFITRYTSHSPFSVTVPIPHPQRDILLGAGWEERGKREGGRRERERDTHLRYGELRLNHKWFE
jgi:hypothetical protein